MACELRFATNNFKLYLAFGDAECKYGEFIEMKEFSSLTMNAPYTVTDWAEMASNGFKNRQITGRDLTFDCQGKINAGSKIHTTFIKMLLDPTLKSIEGLNHIKYRIILPEGLEGAEQVGMVGIEGNGIINPNGAQLLMGDPTAISEINFQIMANGAPEIYVPASTENPLPKGASN